MQVAVPKGYDDSAVFKVISNPSNSDIVNFNSALAASVGKDSGHYSQAPLGIFFPNKFLDTMAALLLESCTVARRLNESEEFWCILRGSRSTAQLHSFTRQECSAFSGYSGLIFLVVRGYLQGLIPGSDFRRAENCLDLFVKSSLEALQDVIVFMQDSRRHRDHNSLWSSVISNILNNLSMCISYIGSASGTIARDFNLSVLDENAHKFHNCVIALLKINHPDFHEAIESFLVAIGERYLKPLSLGSASNSRT